MIINTRFSRITVLNGRIYTPWQVLLNHFLVIEGGEIIQMDNQKYLGTRDLINVVNAENAIIAPSFVNPCVDFRFPASRSNFESGEMNFLTGGTTGICEVRSISQVQENAQSHDDSKSTFYSKVKHLGTRILWDYSEVNQRLILLAENILFNNLNHSRILELRVPECDPKALIELATLCHTYKTRFCVVVSSKNYIKDTDLSRCDCISVPLGFPLDNVSPECWVELRLPPAEDFDNFRNINIGLRLHKIIIGNYMSRTKRSSNISDSFKYSMYYSNENEFEFMSENQVVRYLNGQLGVPLNWAIGICTENINSYLNLNSSGVIKINSKISLINIDSKLKIKRVFL